MQKATYDGARDRDSPDYNLRVQEICGLEILEHVLYQWAEDNGYLEEILGYAKYLALTELEYNEPEKSPLTHTGMDENPSDHDRAELKTENDKNDKLLQAWWTRLGLLEGLEENIWDELDEKYYQQLQHHLLKYKKVQS